MKRPARGATCSSSGRGSGRLRKAGHSSFLWFAALTSVMADRAPFAYFIADKCLALELAQTSALKFVILCIGLLNSLSNLQIDNTTRTQLNVVFPLVKRRTKTLSSTIVGYRSLSIKGKYLIVRFGPDFSIGETKGVRIQNTRQSCLVRVWPIMK